METSTNMIISVFKSAKLLIANLELFFIEDKILVVSAVYVYHIPSSIILLVFAAIIVRV